LIVSAWRIVKRKHVKDAFTGEGARIFGGRWNNPGTSLVYAAESQSLAALEMLVRLEEPDLLAAYVVFAIEFQRSLMVDFDPLRLPKNWQDDPAPAACTSIGDDWVASGSSAVLRVPSAVIPTEHNFLLNPLHRDFAQLTISPPDAFSLDFRLLKKRVKRV
jgi:RES domain-containing protein